MKKSSLLFLLLFFLLTLYPVFPAYAACSSSAPNGCDGFDPGLPDWNDGDIDTQADQNSNGIPDANEQQSPQPSPTQTSSPQPSPTQTSSPPNQSPPSNSSNQGVFAWIDSIWKSFSKFLQSFWGGFSKFLAFVLGVIADPLGAVNTFLCKIIDAISIFWPSTPESLKLGNLLISMGSTIPLVGTAVIYDFFTTASSMLAIVLLVKLYKLIPFKMS